MRQEKSCLHIIPGLGSGGAERVLYDLVKEQSEINHRIIALSSQAEFHYERFASLRNVEITCFNFSIGQILKNLTLLFNYVNSDRSPTIVLWLYHSCAFSGLAYLFIRNKKIIWSIHNTDFFPAKIGFKSFVSAIICLPFSYVVPDSIIYCADSSKYFHEKFGFSRKRSIVVYNGYDETEYYEDLRLRESTRRDFAITMNDTVIGMIARFVPVKNHSLFMESARLLLNDFENLIFLFCGKNCDSLQFYELARAHNIHNNSIFLPETSDINAILNAIDICALSSDSEAMPRIIGEAILASRPCISTNVGDAIKLIGCAGVIPIRSDSYSYSSSLGFLIGLVRGDDCHLRSAVDNSRNRIISNFSVKRMASGYFEHFN